jgi:hypothetical protein
MNSIENSNPTRLVVLADKDGAILAAALGDSPDGGRIGIVPSDGQTVHDVPLPDGPERTAVFDSLHQFYAKVEGDRPTFARRTDAR